MRIMAAGGFHQVADDAGQLIGSRDPGQCPGLLPVPGRGGYLNCNKWTKGFAASGGQARS